MPRTQVKCPNCRQPVVADIEQLFDVGVDPSAKQQLLSGGGNFIQCQFCGYQGSLPTPIVYHDPDKELLLTFVPPELAFSRDEQERVLGSLINRAVSNLPQEKRKAYLFSPQPALTVQGLIERVLEAEGITKEMIQAQQQKIRLIQRLLAATGDTLDELVEQESELMDAEFFTLLSRLAESALATGDQASARSISELQQSLLPKTEYGRELQAQSAEIEAAMETLRAIGNQLTREKLLDLMVEAPTETRLGTLVSLTRPALDYQFYQILTERIGEAVGEHQQHLKNVREQILNITREIDEQMQLRRQQAQQNLEILLQAENLQQATLQNLPVIDDFFLQVLTEELEAARKSGDLGRSGKLSQIMEVIQQASTPPEVEFIEELLEIDDEQELTQALVDRKDEITPSLLDMLTGLVSQTQNGEDKQLAERIQFLYRKILRMSMEANLREG